MVWVSIWRETELRSPSRTEAHADEGKGKEEGNVGVNSSPGRARAHSGGGWLMQGHAVAPRGISIFSPPPPARWPSHLLCIRLALVEA